MEKETYEISVVCHNCHHVPGQKVPGGIVPHPTQFKIPKGTTVQKFLQEMTCENCGCEGFMGLN